MARFDPIIELLIKVIGKIGGFLMKFEENNQTESVAIDFNQINQMHFPLDRCRVIDNLETTRKKGQWMTTLTPRHVQ